MKNNINSGFQLNTINKKALPRMWQGFFDCNDLWDVGAAFQPRADRGWKAAPTVKLYREC
jgi:hypothetical protein